MDVTCERCSTEYEFDDALVSERGTTVKCTTCGHQFRIRRRDSGGVPERWVVRTVDGRELEFTALRELQAAITHRLVTRDDVLSRDGGRPRRLGSIPELEPFFTTASSSVSMPAPSFGREPPGPARAHIPTPPGLGAIGPLSRTETSVAIPLPIAVDRGGVVYGNAVEVPARAAYTEPSTSPSARLATQPMASQQPFRAAPSLQPPPSSSLPQEPPRTGATIRAMAPVGPAHELAGLAQPPLPPPPRTPALPPVTPRISSVPPPRAITVDSPRTMATPPPPPLDRRGRSEPPPTVAPMTMPMSSSPASPVSSAAIRSVPPLTPTPGEVRYTLDDATSDFRFSTVTPSKRQGSARLIVGIVVGGLLLFAAFAVGKPYLTGAPEAPTAAAPPVDARAETLRKEAEAALAKGDLDGAQDALVRASALAEKDPAVALALARVAATKADFVWLRMRLRKEDDPERDSLAHELAGLAERAQGATDRAAALAPEDGGVVLARIHALLLAGRSADARKLVPTLGAGANVEESALVRALLDLGEESPDWTTVGERLRTAMAPEQGLGRARSLLIYALARSGNVTDAKAELGRLRGEKVHPLEAPLRAYVDRRAEEVSKQDLAAAVPAPAAPAPPAAARATEGGASAPSPTPAAAPEAPTDLPAGVHIDTTDLPGMAPSPAPAPTPESAPAPTPEPTAAPKAPSPDPPAIDTSDLPGVAPSP